MSGNIGNQTAALTIRALARGQINKENWRLIMRKEILLSLVNGLLWGGVISAVAYMLYNRFGLGRGVARRDDAVFCVRCFRRVRRAAVDAKNRAGPGNRRDSRHFRRYRPTWVFLFSRAWERYFCYEKTDAF